jgi:hypothetical protein
MQFWNANSTPPELSYINFRYWNQVKPDEIGPRQMRMVIAASTLMDIIIAQFDLVEKFYKTDRSSRIPPYNELDSYGGISVFDELVMGKEKKKGWLGQPLSETIEMARKSTAVMKANDAASLHELAGRISGAVDARVEDGKLVISAKDKNATGLSFTFPGLTVLNRYLTLFINASCEKMGPYPKEIDRLFWVESGEEDDLHTKHMGWANYKPFESVICFRNIQAESTDLQFTMDGTEELYIHGIEAYAGGDLRCREFENGAVLVNPTNDPAVFDLASLFPGKSFRRLQGSPGQDPVVNSGQAVSGDRITIPARDALFLVKE